MAMEEIMKNMNRRSVLALAAAAGPTLVLTTSAAAQMYGPEEGAELLSGVRQVDLSERQAVIPGYASVSMRDIVVEPGAEVPPSAMENDMVCHMVAGDLEIIQDGQEFTAREGDVWTCAIGTEEGGRNVTDRQAVMRVTDLYRA